MNVWVWVISCGEDVCVCEGIQILLVSIQLFSSSMCVQEEKKNELSNKSKQYPTNNKRFSSKVPRADWVSILNLKTRLSHVNFFIYKELKECLWLVQYLSIVSTFFLFVRKAKSNCSFQFETCYVLLMLTYTIKTISFKKYKTFLHEHVWNGIDLVWHYKEVNKSMPQDIFNFEHATILVLFAYLFNFNTFECWTK